MTGGERRRAFADAFIAQARSDWLVYRVLTERPDVALCHQLHYLQMACEKNTEYPWERRVTAPCNFGFPSLELLRQPGGRSFLNLVERALNDFDSVTLQ
jgi:hypothetical protein